MPLEEEGERGWGRGERGSYAISSPQHTLHISFKQLLSISMAGGHHLGEVNQCQFIVIIHL